MSRAAIALSVGLSLIPACASALDWSVKGVLSAAVELNDNQFLKTMLSGGSLGSYSSAAANFEGRTPTSKFDFDVGSTYKKYWGSGVDGLASEYINYNVKAYYEEQGKTLGDRTYIEASYAQQSAALAVFNSLGIASTASGFLNQTAATAGWDRTLTMQDYVSLWVRSIYTDYDPSNAGIAFTDTLASGTLKHKLTSTITLTSASEAEYVTYNNILGTNAYILRNLAGAEATLSPLLSFKGAVGGTYLQIDKGFGAVFTPNLPSVQASSSSADWLFYSRLTYKALKTMSLYLDASRTIGPSSLGTILTQTSVRGGADYDINVRNVLSMYADFTRIQSPNTTDFVSATIVLSSELSRTWTSKVSYRYIHRFTATGSAAFDPVLGGVATSGLGPANSNSLLFVLSKSFVVLPHGT